MSIKWRENEFQKFLLGTIFKLRNGINAVGEFQYNTILKIRDWSGWHIGNMFAKGPKGRGFKPRSRVVDLRYVRGPQVEIRASEQNLSDFSRSL